MKDSMAVRNEIKVHRFCLISAPPRPSATRTSGIESPQQDPIPALMQANNDPSLIVDCGRRLGAVFGLSLKSTDKAVARVIKGRWNHPGTRRRGLRRLLKVAKNLFSISFPCFRFQFRRNVKTAFQRIESRIMGASKWWVGWDSNPGPTA